MSEINTPAPVKQSSGNGFKAVVILLLVLILAVVAFQAFTGYLAAQEQARQDLVRRDACASAADTLSTITDEYTKAAYDNPRVETLAQQQFIATEFQMLVSVAVGNVVAFCAP